MPGCPSLLCLLPRISMHFSLLRVVKATPSSLCCGQSDAQLVVCSQSNASLLCVVDATPSSLCCSQSDAQFVVCSQSHAQLVLHTPLCCFAVWFSKQLDLVCQSLPAICVLLQVILSRIKTIPNKRPEEYLVVTNGMPSHDVWYAQ